MVFPFEERVIQKEEEEEEEEESHTQNDGTIKH